MQANNSTQEAPKYPKAVYKKGTGKQGENGLVTAESRIVKSEEELSQLGQGWCDSPQEAASGGDTKASQAAQEKHGAHASEGVRNVAHATASEEADKAAKRGGK